MIALLAIVATGFAGFGHVAAQERLDVQLGWSGWVPLGVWVPLRIDIVAVQPADAVVDAEVRLAGRSGAPTTFRAPVRLSPGAPQRVTMPVVIADPGRPVTVQLRAGPRELARADVPIGSARVVEGVVLALTREAAGLEFLAGFPRKLRPAYITEDDLPGRWQEYAGATLLVIRDLNPTRVAPAQQQAVIQWVRQGGHLLVTSGERMDVLRVSWLAPLLPAVPSRLSRQRIRGMAQPVTVTLVTPRPGADVRPSEGPPLSVRWRVGAGVVTLWTFDAFAPPVRAWAGRMAMWEEALAAQGAQPIAAADLAEMLPATSPLPGSVQVLLIVISVLYVLAARAVLRRSGGGRRGWLAIPGVAAVFGLVLLGFAQQARRAGNAVAVLSVVEALPGTDHARVTGYVSVLSPYGGAVAVAAPEGAMLQPLGAVPLMITGGSAAAGTAPGRMQFELTHLVSLPVRGRAVQDEDGLRLEVENRANIRITGALLYRDGQRYRLPDVGPMMIARLDPAQWEVVARRPVLPEDGGERLEEWVLARLQRRTSPDLVWLVGRVRDRRLEVASGTARVRGAHHMIVVPVPITTRTSP